MATQKQTMWHTALNPIVLGQLAVLWIALIFLLPIGIAAIQGKRNRTQTPTDNDQS